MRDRLPVHIEDRELPKYENVDNFENRKNSYGYVSVLYLASIIITAVSVITIMMFGNR